MKIFFTSFIFTINCLLAFAQDHYIFLQSESKQPFFVKMNDKILNSSDPGFLIIPKVSEGAFTLTIGSVQSGTEQDFSISIDRKDIGFLVQNTGDKEWHLMNLQTQTILYPTKFTEKKSHTLLPHQTQTDAFSVMLANAVHDPTILQTVIVQTVPPKINEEIKTDSGHIVAINDPVIVKPGVKKKIKKNSKTVNPSSINNNVVSGDSTKTFTDTSLTKSSLTDVALSNNSLKKKLKKKSRPAANQPLLNTVGEDSTKIFDSSLTKVSSTDVALSKISVKKTLKKTPNAHDSAHVKKGAIKKDIAAKINDQDKKDTTQNIASADDIASSISVTNKLKNTGADGTEMIYVDEHGDKKDTIRILIPVEKTQNKEPQKEIKTELPVVVAPQNIDSVKLDSVKREPEKLQEKKPEKEVKTEAVVTNISENTQPAKPEPDKKKTELKFIDDITDSAATQQPSQVSMLNSDCKNFATDEDFLKLRKKMVSETDDDKMISVAKKVFKTKCFTTEQIKNLSVLFLTDEGKYKFFDTSYPFVSDSESFKNLENQLSDTYYLTRFRAMIHK